MTECSEHQAMDASRGLHTLRCAHVEREYVAEQVSALAQTRYVVRVHPSGVVVPQVIFVDSAAEADRIFAAMEARMLAGAAFGEPYGVVE